MFPHGAVVPVRSMAPTLRRSRCALDSRKAGFAQGAGRRLRLHSGTENYRENYRSFSEDWKPAHNQQAHCCLAGPETEAIRPFVSPAAGSVAAEVVPVSAADDRRGRSSLTEHASFGGLLPATTANNLRHGADRRLPFAPAPRFHFVAEATRNLPATQSA